MFYRLREPWAFRGWKKLPYALRDEYGEQRNEKPFFFNKEVFLALLSCNGQEDLDVQSLSENCRKAFEELTAAGFLEASIDAMAPLEPWQRYKVYPSRYLRSAHWSITGKCNFRCRHCLVSAPEAKHPQLPLEDCLKIVDEIASCGIQMVDITGGEPLVRNDFEEIVKAIDEHGMEIGTLFTNASLLNEEVLDILQRHHQKPVFQLSFDGLGHHDWLRGVEGAEKQADAAFRLLQEKGWRANAAMCIHRKNQDSLRSTIKYLSSLGVGSLRVNAPQSLGIWKKNSTQYALANEETWEVYLDCITHYFEDQMPISLDLDGFFHCGKGKTDYSIPYMSAAKKQLDYSRIRYCESMRYHVYIGADGRLAPCMGFSSTKISDKFENVLEHPLGELTLRGNCHDVVETRVSDFLARNPECAGCEHLSACLGGCMVADITDEGDYLVPDRQCCYFHKHVGEQAVRETADAAIAQYCGSGKE